MQIEKSKSVKRVITGNGRVDNEHEVICITIINEQETQRYMLPKCMGTEMEIFNAFGDKISALEKAGYDIDYRFDQEPLEIQSVNNPQK